MAKESLTDKLLDTLVKNVNPKAKVPRGFGLWSRVMAIRWLQQNQKKGKSDGRQTNTSTAS